MFLAVTMGGLLARFGSFLICDDQSESLERPRRDNCRTSSCEHGSLVDDKLTQEPMAFRTGINNEVVYYDRHQLRKALMHIETDPRQLMISSRHERMLAKGKHNFLTYNRRETQTKTAGIGIEDENSKKSGEGHDAAKQVELSHIEDHLSSVVVDMSIDSRPHCEAGASLFSEESMKPYDIAAHQSMPQCGLTWDVKLCPDMWPRLKLFDGEDDTYKDGSIFESSVPQQLGNNVPECKPSFNNKVNAADNILPSNNFRFAKPGFQVTCDAHIPINQRSSSHKNKNKPALWDKIREKSRCHVYQTPMKHRVGNWKICNFAWKKNKINHAPGLDLDDALRVSQNMDLSNYQYLKTLDKSQKETNVKLEKSSDDGIQDISTSTVKPRGLSSQQYLKVSEAPEIRMQENPIMSMTQRNTQTTPSPLKSSPVVSLNQWHVVALKLGTINKFLAISLREVLIVCQENVSTLKSLKITYGKDDEYIKKIMVKVKALMTRVQKLLQKCQHYIDTSGEQMEGDDKVMERESYKHKLEQEVYNLTRQARNIKKELDNFHMESEMRLIEMEVRKVNRSTYIFDPSQFIARSTLNQRENVSCRQAHGEELDRMHHYRELLTNEKDALAEYVHGYYDDLHLQGVKGKKGPKYVEERSKPKRHHIATNEQTTPQNEVKLTKRQRKQLLKSKKNKVLNTH